VGSYFQVLPKDQADQVRSSEEGLRALIQANPADNSPMFLLAFLYEDNGMLDEAARIYGELAKKIGPQDWVQTQLTGLMNKLGWSKPEYAIPH
jgi:cytochrome c-type biogenesis protein CcmH/NrfG